VRTALSLNHLANGIYTGLWVRSCSSPMRLHFAYFCLSAKIIVFCIFLQARFSQHKLEFLKINPDEQNHLHGRFWVLDNACLRFINCKGQRPSYYRIFLSFKKAKNQNPVCLINLNISLPKCFFSRPNVTVYGKKAGKLVYRPCDWLPVCFLICWPVCYNRHNRR